MKKHNLNINFFREVYLNISEQFIYNQYAASENAKFFALQRTVGFQDINDPGFDILNFNKYLIYAYRMMGLMINHSWIRRLSQCDILHIHFGFDAFYILRVLKNNDCKIVVTFHGYDINRRESKNIWFKKYRRNIIKVFERADKIIAVSEFIKLQLLNAGCPEEKVVVSYIGVPIYLDPPLCRNQKDNTILFVGRLEAVKGCEYVIRAAASAQKRGYDINLKIIGDGSLRMELEQLADELDCKCIFMGSLSNDKVKDEMRRALILCNPSVPLSNGECEALGMVYIESQTMGTPIVAFNVGGVREAVPPELYSQLVPNIDHAGLEKAIIRLIDDTNYDQIVETGKKYVDEKFDIIKCNKRRIRIYESLYE